MISKEEIIRIIAEFGFKAYNDEKGTYFLQAKSKIKPMTQIRFKKINELFNPTQPEKPVEQEQPVESVESVEPVETEKTEQTKKTEKTEKPNKTINKNKTNNKKTIKKVNK